MKNCHIICLYQMKFRHTMFIGCIHILQFMLRTAPSLWHFFHISKKFPFKSVEVWLGLIIIQTLLRERNAIELCRYFMFEIKCRSHWNASKKRKEKYKSFELKEFLWNQLNCLWILDSFSRFDRKKWVQKEQKKINWIWDSIVVFFHGRIWIDRWMRKSTPYHKHKFKPNTEFTPISNDVLCKLFSSFEFLKVKLAQDDKVNHLQNCISWCCQSGFA